MRTIKICTTHLQFFSIIVHLFKEIFRIVRMIIKLITFNPHDISMCVLFSEKLLSEVLSQGKSCVVTTREHKTIQKLIDCKYVSCFEVCACSSNIRGYWTNSNFGLFHAYFPLLTKFYNYIASHYFGQGCTFTLKVFPLTVNKAHLINIVDGPTFSRYLWHRFVQLCLPLCYRLWLL